MIKTKRSDWIGIGSFKFLWCKKPLWINFIPFIPIEIIDDSLTKNKNMVRE